MSNDDQEIIQTHGEKVVGALEAAYHSAEVAFNSGQQPNVQLTPELAQIIQTLSDKAEKASAAFNNVVTGTSIKVVHPEYDVRYHQTNIQEGKFPSSWFNHRGISEKFVYPWLNKKNFEGAKSGWQTRTLERPKPYFLDYDEKIAAVKSEFLRLYDALESKQGGTAEDILTFFVYLEIVKRDEKNITLATPNIDDIATIIGHVGTHINFSYAGKGGSRLPVLALYAIYELVTKETTRYQNISLLPLNAHSAADSQTGSAGDIEFADSAGRIVEAIEVKHQIVFSEALVSDAETKVSPFQLDRYYMLTSHSNCKPDAKMRQQLLDIKNRIGCQVIVNGVLPTILYYLRLVSDPSEFYKKYTQQLDTDSDVSHEHRQTWNEIIIPPK